jgi:hypothetical protein
MKRSRSASLTARDDVSRRRQPQPSGESREPESGIVVKREIPLDIVQNTAEYLGRVARLLSFRGVSTAWQGAVSDAVGFLNGRCWTHLGNDGPLLMLDLDDDDAVVARCALLCLAHRLETLEWTYLTDQLDFVMRLLGENNMVLTALSLTDIRRMNCRPITDVSWLQNFRALKKLILWNSTGATDAGIRDLELSHFHAWSSVISTLEELSLCGCKQITDVSCLQNCRALKKLNLLGTNVTDAGIRGLELILTLEELNLGCTQITDVSSLQHCRALKKLNLSNTSVTDAGIRGLEHITTLEDLSILCCMQITDVSCLQNCRALKKLVLLGTNVTDADIRGLELILTLEELSLWGCKQITDVSCLRHCRALKNLILSSTSVTDAGIRGLELIPTLEGLDLRGCKQVHDLRGLRTRLLLRLAA